MVHGARANGKAHGVVNTKVSVVRKMLDLADYVEDKDLSGIKILEPSAGEGVFAIEIIDRLYKSSIKYKFNFTESLTNIHLCEIDKEIAARLRQNIAQKIESLGTFTNAVNIFIGDFLQTEFTERFDLVIGNPPYVRNENIPEELKDKYQAKFTTFSNRSDIYIPFYEKGLNYLNSNGFLSYVCSNRWLKNQYGKRLRQLISKHFHIDAIIDLENADIFEEEVLGYPAITNFSKQKTKHAALYFTLDDLPAFLEFNRKKEISKPLNLASSNWFSFSFTGATYERNLKSIEQQNYKIGIGVATGRDSIFISNVFQGKIEEELLIPILTSKDLKGSTIDWQGNYIINPFDKSGNLINLDAYPMAKEYFKKHRAELSSRHVAKQNTSNWYKTIDKIYYPLLAKPKVILPDISGNKFIHVDKGNYYPHHNLYYINGGNYDEMCLVAAILMSDFVYQQLLSIGNKMNGGYPRWQSQNLRKLLIPIIKSIPQEIKASLLDAYHQNDCDTINQIITRTKIAEFKISEGQLTLFEPTVEYDKMNTPHNNDHHAPIP